MPVDSKTYRNQGNPEVLALVPPECKTILDVGCGNGANAQQLAQRGITIDGITLSENEKLEASEVCRNVYLHNLEEGLPE